MFDIRRIKNKCIGIPVVVQRDQQYLGSTGTQVRPVWHSGLGIWHCRSCGLGHDCSSELIPGPGALYAAGQQKMKKNNNNNNNNKCIIQQYINSVKSFSQHMKSTLIKSFNKGSLSWIY